MKYFAGKFRHRKQIGEILNKIINNNKIENYIECFCGGCWVTTEVVCRGRFASDIHPDLILMWKELQKGWIPPSSVSEEEYIKLREDANNSSMRAFAGFGCSFGAKFFGGYARSPGVDRNYASEAKNSLLKKIKKLSDVIFSEKDYKSWTGTVDAIFYCDPPYDGQTGFSGTPKFDTKDFWNWIRQMSKSNIVITSEYTAPQDFKVIAEFATKTDMNSKNNTKLPRIEKLFIHQDSQSLATF